MIHLFLNTILPLIATSVLYLNSFSVSAAPLQPGVPILADLQFQACLDEAIQANGWTQTEEVMELVCPNRNIEILEGIQFFINLAKLDLRGNQVFIPSPLEQLQQLKILDLSDNKLFDVYLLQMLHQLTQLNLSGNKKLQAQEIQMVIQANPGLTHIGIGGIAMGDLSWLPPQGLYSEYQLVALDM